MGVVKTKVRIYEFCLWFAIVRVNLANASRNCPKLQPVPIDEDFFFNKQPAGGFYAVYSAGEDSMPNYKPKRMNKNLRGSNKACLKTQVVLSGGGQLTAPSVNCYYKNSVSVMYCETPNDGSAAAAAAAVRAVGFTVPNAQINVIVETDNSTYLAYGICLDGAMYIWQILSTDPKLKTVYTRTAKALDITLKEVKESRGKRMRFARSQLTKGACGATNPITAGVGAINERLSGLFG